MKIKIFYARSESRSEAREVKREKCRACGAPGQLFYGSQRFADWANFNTVHLRDGNSKAMSFRRPVKLARAFFSARVGPRNLLRQSFGSTRLSTVTSVSCR